MDAAPGMLKRIFMNPLAVREVRQACRSWKLVVFLSVYLLVQGAIFSIWIYTKSDHGSFNDPTSIGRYLFITMSVVLVTVVMLVFPAFSSTAIASEHEKKSFDLLLLTPLAPWEIALGKFFAAGIQASVFLIATVPLFAMANLFGGIEPEVFFVTLWTLVLLSVLISFIGVYASSLVQRSIPAVLVTYLFAFVMGLVLLVIFVTLVALRSFATAAFPLVGFFSSPTVAEGAFYMATLTVSCGIYCSYLFLSTTNRLKPTSHNKSTNMRLYWLAVMVLVPAQVAGYFLIARLPDYGTIYGTLVTGAIYITMLLSVPALTFAAEPPVASRRVRREMEKMPHSFMRAGGSLLFPGSMRGALYTTVVTLLGFGLLMLAASFCFHALQTRMEDKTQLMADYVAATGVKPASSFGPLAGLLGAAPVSSGVPEAQMRDGLTTFYGWELKGFALCVLALLVTILATAQITWRLSLSGLSRTISSVLAGLIVAVWLAVPYIAQNLMPGEYEMDSAKVAQFSPIHGALTGASWGTAHGRADLTPGSVGSRHMENAENLGWRWTTFMGFSLLLTGGLALTNTLTYRKVMRTFASMSAQQQQPIPVQITQAQIDQVMAAVTQPLPAAPVQPPAPPQA